jgi:hypothetical protein
LSISVRLRNLIKRRSRPDMGCSAIGRRRNGEKLIKILASLNVTGDKKTKSIKIPSVNTERCMDALIMKS